MLAAAARAWRVRRSDAAVLAALLIIAVMNQACSDGADEKATLVVTTTGWTGNTDHVVELTTRGRTVSAKVVHHDNPPTREESFEGDLSAIYTALTGTMPEVPSDCVEVASILKGCAAHGWQVVSDTSKERDHHTIERTIALRR